MIKIVCELQQRGGSPGKSEERRSHIKLSCFRGVFFFFFLRARQQRPAVFGGASDGGDGGGGGRERSAGEGATTGTAPVSLVTEKNDVNQNRRSNGGGRLTDEAAGR